MSFGLHINKDPNETYSFVGSVPFFLGWTHKDGTLLRDTPEDQNFVTKQMMLPSSYRKIKTRTFLSRVAAAMIAAQLGFKVQSGLE